MNRDITFFYISRLRYHTDELGLVVQGHLLIEFVLNEIIRRTMKKSMDLLSDHRSYTFAVKSQVLYSIGLIPDHIYRNIRRINQMRNHLAHTLDWDSVKLDYKFSPAEETCEVDVRDSRPFRRVTLRKYIKMLCLGTLSQLRNHFYTTYGEFPVSK